MKEKVKLLNEASRAYYQEDKEIMSNLEFDRLYDELVQLEKELGVVLSNSPTVRVGYEVLSNLPKEQHEFPMLSLDKTKSATDFKAWLGNHRGILSWKLDGLTIALSYSQGRLQKAITRGNGEIGEVVTNNAKVFANLPVNIAFQGDLVLRGEAVISYSDFHKINEGIQDEALKYRNPRNLCSGSVRQLNNQITAERNVQFFAFALMKAEGVEFNNSRLDQLKWLKNQGFDIVTYKETDASKIEEDVEWFAKEIVNNDLPSDGLVLAFDDMAYGETLGSTSKFPRDSIAFKWEDEIKETKLLEVEWSASRTGLINPIAIFQPVELEGTTVSRAGVHNISIMESLELGVDDRICVYKANMIIPQIADNLTRSHNIEIPEACPACNEKTEIKQESGIKFLYCINPDCSAKHIKSFTHFVSRDALAIDGLSEATLEKFINKGFLKEFADLFHLKEHKEDIMVMEGFGKKSYANLEAAIEKARKTSTTRLLYALGIPTIGLSNAKNISRAFGHDWSRIENASFEELTQIDGIGNIMAKAYLDFFQNEKNQRIIKDLLQELEFEEIAPSSSDQAKNLDGLIFVITGSLEQFKNRNELRDIIEEKGGKVTDSVTSKTSYLINNDILSKSSKNKKAKELGIPIITEQEIVDLLNGNKDT